MSENVKVFKNGNLIVTLDRSKVIPHDPGQDTPALVSLRTKREEFCSTYDCACGEGELMGDRNVYPLTESQLNWLNGLEDKISDFLQW